MRRSVGLLIVFVAVSYLFVGCRSVRTHRREADEAAAKIIAEKQQQALGRREPFTIERPADTLRRRLLLDQKLPYAGPASLGVKDLKPIDHWPDDDYLDPAKGAPATMPAGYQGGVLRLSLPEALEVAAYNSREYQSRKETIFTDALALELERDGFRTQFLAALNGDATLDTRGDDAVAGVVGSPEVGAGQKFMNGATASVRLALDLAKLLTQPHSASLGLATDASITIPLLRGSGRHIVMEPLTQAERNVAYDLLDFEQYKRTFAVNVASQYLAVLQQFDRLRNQEDNYKRIITSTLKSRRLKDEGQLSQIEYDQAFQQELSARESWISAQLSCERQLDSFKVLLGLPADSEIELDAEELQRLSEATAASLQITPPSDVGSEASTQPSDRADAGTRVPTSMPTMEQIELEPPSMVGAGRFEMPDAEAIKLALKYRPDLRVAQGEVYDAQRKIVVAADALRAGLNIVGSAAFGERRGVGSASSPDASFRPEKGSYSLGGTLDLPLERTAEQNVYRTSLIRLEAATRAVQQLEDDIKVSVRNQLRTLLQARESLKTQSQAVAVAKRRVDSTDKFLQFGLGVMRDLLDAQSSLVAAQNQLTSALVEYRIAELQLQRDMGLLEVNHQGLWREYSPEGVAQ